MSVVLVLQCSLDFKREIVVHFKHHVQQLIVLLLATPCVADQGECQNIELSHIEAALRGEVGVDDGACESKASETPGPLGCTQEQQLLLVRLIAFVEAAILLVPLDVLSQHLDQEILVLRVLTSDTSGVGLTENVFTDSAQEEQISSSLQHI